MKDTINYLEVASTVIDECSRSILSIDPEQVEKYISAIENGEKVFFVGVGRVLLMLQAIAKRYSHLGIKAVIVGEITEPAITADDVLVVGSGSGETMFPVGIALKAKKIGVTIVHIGSNPESSLTHIEDVFLRIPAPSKNSQPDDIKTSQPMTTLFEQSLLLFGDISAKMMIENRSIVMNDLWRNHANLE